MKYRRTRQKRVIGRSNRGSVACVESLEHRVLFHDGEFHAVANTLPTLTITRQATNASENGAIRSFNITRSGSLAGALPVSFQIGGRAKNGVDYGRIGSAATIPAGEATVRIKVRPVDDALVEGTEAVTFTLVSSDTYNLGASYTSTIRITDNDSSANTPTVSVSAPVGSASESGRTRAFTISRTGDLTRELPVSILMGGKATNGVDYGKFGTSAIIAAGQSAVTLRVRPIDDSKIESTESVTLNLNPGAGYAVGTSSATLRIFDNDFVAIPTVTISAPASVAENGTSAFTITRAGATDQSLTVHFHKDGTAANGVDYGTIGTSVQIAAGQTQTMIALNVVDDSAAESDETVGLILDADPAYAIGSPSAATTTITDNDTAFGTSLTWTSVAASPVSRGESEHAVIDNKMYVFGGYTDFSATNSTRCDVYDPATNTWTRLADMPVGVTHGGTAVVGRKVYIAAGYTGGPGGSQIFATSQVQVYDVDTNTWSTIASLPQARGGGAMAAVQTTDLSNVLHYFGGSDSARMDRTEHWAFDLTNPSAGWVSKAPIPTSRTHMGSVTINDKIYAVGGQKNQDAAEAPQAALEMYDYGTDTWTAKASMPFGRSHIASSTIVVSGRIVTLGGETTFQNSVANVSAYNPATNTWQELTALPAARASGVAGFLNGAYYYSTGGVTSNTYKGTIIG